MSSYFGPRKSKAGDREPLLPQYPDDTALQRELHHKLHSYQMYRALGKGFMPSTEQLIINLRTIVASDVLNPDNPDLSDSGYQLAKHTKTWLKQFMDLLQHKNTGDDVQDLIWGLSKSRISVDTGDISRRASKAKANADTAAAIESLQTVGSLLLTNPEFRLFMSDVSTVGRQVFQDTAATVSDAAADVAERAAPSDEQVAQVADPEADEAESAPTRQELADEAADMTKILGNGAAKVGQAAQQSVVQHMSGGAKDTLLSRLKKTVISLRQRTDYSDSVSTLSRLIQRYARVYSQALEATAAAAQDDVNANPELDQAMHNLWRVVSSFGEAAQWDELKRLAHKVFEHHQHDPDFEKLMVEAGNTVQAALMDPDFFQSADERFESLRLKSQSVGPESPIQQDVNALLQQVQRTVQSVACDGDVARLTATTHKIVDILSPTDAASNSDLVHDAVGVFMPLLVNAVQYIPIPRVEVSTPALDLLLENIVLEPGETINQSSFLPFHACIDTLNSLSLRKSHTGTLATATTHHVTLKLTGLSVRASDLGFWLRARAGPLRLFTDEGLASFALDARGTDIHLDVQLTPHDPAATLTLTAVRVHIHKLGYKLRKSKLSWLAWLLKPFLRPRLRRALEAHLAGAIAGFFAAADREVRYARERLRATRVAEPRDLATFVQAVRARMAPAAADPDVYSRVGVDAPARGVFAGRYAPGSLVKLWNEEGAPAEELVDEGGTGGWRNEVFDVVTVAAPTAL